ncbi:hypothetical protein O1Q96_12130 [Streptomyces sp. Qhu-G9]|uniref:hypothetical protein n=1 Tax=Streptomyces sp. Qhu-G9 TaxID=3452799 RepID=UPI0022AC48B9|nr:hypothetical protein [Streptomyces aurantiacus]WAU80442.1 hypothetical protein O1Q96_12130 [Streptomyces aurantiacus]
MTRSPAPLGAVPPPMSRRTAPSAGAAPPSAPAHASTVFDVRRSDGALPVTTFLTTGSTTIGATMDRAGATASRA